MPERSEDHSVRVSDFQSPDVFLQRISLVVHRQCGQVECTACGNDAQGRLAGCSHEDVGGARLFRGWRAACV